MTEIYLNIIFMVLNILISLGFWIYSPCKTAWIPNALCSVFFFALAIGTFFCL